MQALVEFMYKGQVNVSQAGLPDLVKSGDLLQIRGLCNSDIAAGLSPQKPIETNGKEKSPKRPVEEQQNENVSNISSSSTTKPVDKESRKEEEIDCMQTEIKQEEIGES